MKSERHGEEDGRYRSIPHWTIQDCNVFSLGSRRLQKAMQIAAAVAVQSISSSSGVCSGKHTSENCGVVVGGVVLQQAT